MRYLFLIFFLPTIAFSHELKPSIVNFQFIKQQKTLDFKLDIQLNLEAILANIDPSHDNTNDSENSEYYNSLRKLNVSELQNLFNQKLKDFTNNIQLFQNNQTVQFKIDNIFIREVGDIAISRETQITLSGKNILENNLNFSWSKSYGPVILRVSDLDKEIVYTEYLKTNAKSKNFSLSKNQNQSLLSEILNYLIIGFEHIVPKGLDHILFVLGLFLFSPKFKPLLIQVSAFTLAHTITIFLGVLNIVVISPSIVEPIIALSIAYVALENIFFKNISLWRPIVVFVFAFQA